MKTKSLRMLLALSLMFNLCVLIGFTWQHASAGPVQAERGLVNAVATELQLDGEQSRSFAQMRADLRREMTTLSESIATVQRSLVSELRQDAADPARIRELVIQRSDLEHQRQLVRAELFSRFVTKLSPQQRQRMADRMAQRISEGLKGLDRRSPEAGVESGRNQRGPRSR